ncbi:nucleolar protein 12 [Hippoglossus hippoglossus]|uniref:nucleolar protein 12 n=1 Tax=Hippoglossus hippoglossus TaxID=8267 RepID=UPI00148E56A8|nr:nucleolar protein 12 [Hippoglossus hippoglossus]
MKNLKKPHKSFNNNKFKPGSKKRENKCILTFDDKGREDFLTGFHKRKLERRKSALAEIRKKIKEEQIRVRVERHKEYIKLLKERTDALEEAEDDLENAVTSTTETLQYDHPNHTVTVTTISDLDLSGAHLLGPEEEPVIGESKEEEKKVEVREQTVPMPKKSGHPIMNKKIRSLMSSLSTFTCKKGKGKQDGRRGQNRSMDKKRGITELKKRTGKSSKWQRRRQTGRKGQHQE